MEYTYELPDSNTVLETICQILHNSESSSDKKIYRTILNANLDFNESTNFSGKRWDAYDLDIVFRIPASVYALNTKLLTNFKNRLKNLCEDLIPSECGYDVKDISFVPKLEHNKVDAKDTLIKNLDSKKLNILTSDILHKGERMSNAYLIMYCLENYLRTFIDYTLTERIGEDYESKISIPNNVKSKVYSRKNEEAKSKWLPLRGDKLVYYLDFNELGDLISNNWENFKLLIPSQPWIKVKIDELYSIRCLIAHNSYIDDTSFKVLNVDYEQLVKQLGS